MGKGGVCLTCGPGGNDEGKEDHDHEGHDHDEDMTEEEKQADDMNEEGEN